MYFVKPNEQFPESAHRWWLRKDQYTIGELYTWEEESRQIAHRLETYDALVAACKAALPCIARLTPFSVGDPLVDAAIHQAADYADEVRAQLRRAIAKGE